MIIGALVIVGGLKRIAAVTESWFLHGDCLCHRCFGNLFANISHVGAVFTAIFKGAFGLAPWAAVSWARCEAGSDLGHEARRVLQRSRPWFLRYGTFQFQCKRTRASGYVGHLRVYSLTLWSYATLTAFAVLSSGPDRLRHRCRIGGCVRFRSGRSGFATVFGSFGPAFIAIAILLFAFSTVLGWSHYGSKACEYLFGTKSTIVYKVVFVLMIFIGCTMNLGLAWDLSDTFNGLMAIPNLIGVIALSPRSNEDPRKITWHVSLKRRRKAHVICLPRDSGRTGKAM